MNHTREIIAESPDLKRLHEEGLELCIRDGFLLITNIPYVNASRSIRRGTLILALNLTTDTSTGKPPDHTGYFAGDLPHYADGTPIAGIVNHQNITKLADGIVARMYLSSRPSQPDPDYHAKVCRYVDMLEGPARVIDPTATARTHAIIESEDAESPFVFLDTNSARAQIVPITNKLKGLRIAIAGLGGTGSYVLDIVAKTPVKEIHLFDDDEYALHNSYRSPGSPNQDQLRARMSKVEYFTAIYTQTKRGITPHREFLTEAVLEKMRPFDFVFLCIDPGPHKRGVIQFLASHGIPFCDTGLGIVAENEKLTGVANTITVTPKYKSHLDNVPVKMGGDNELYQSNIQIAELNMLNAAMAVIRWKKHFGFYADDRHEHESTYTIGPNMLTNEQIGA